MAKRVFFSFHYQDVVDFRTNVVRQHWVTKDREDAGFFDASLWEASKKKGDAALTQLIAGGLQNTTATCVLVGSETYARPWVRYEIFASIKKGNRVFGVHINTIKDKGGKVKANGPNPFDYLALEYSADGTMVTPKEFVGGKWVPYLKVGQYTLKTAAPQDKRGKAFKLSQLGFETHCWSANNGYDSFAGWVG